MKMLTLLPGYEIQEYDLKIIFSDIRLMHH